MAVKRKFDSESNDEVSRSSIKHLKCIPFPSFEVEYDSNTSSPMDIDMEIEAERPPFHSRLYSSASSISSASSVEGMSPIYPAFDLYPESDMIDQERSSISGVGLIQPSSDTHFTHHSQTCTQIPKLRMACSAGPNGRRSMWTFCEECGAIEMVSS